MKPGDLVSVRWRTGKTVKCVALAVTPSHIRRGLNVPKPGLYLFRGYWYGTDPHRLTSFGKIEGRVGRVIGKVRGHAQARWLGL